MTIHYCRAVTIALLWAVLIYHETGAVETTEVSAFRNLPLLSMEIHRVKRAVTSDFDIDIKLTNLTDKAIDVKEVKVLLPEVIASTRGSQLEKFRTDLHTVSRGNEKIYRLHIPVYHKTLLAALLDPVTLFFVPGTYILRSEAVFTESGGKGSQSIYAQQDLSLEAPLSALLRGGVLGALLLALFVPAYRALKSLHSGERMSATIGGLFFQGLLFLLSGSVVSITAILLLQRIGNLELPITLDVNDYLGGVVIGLFSYPVGNALYDRFFGE